ncbi:MAG: DNA-J related domain-containing protein [Acidiferrobacterales bacterium]
MNTTLLTQPGALAILKRLLEQCPAGLSEFALMQKLRLNESIDFIDREFRDNLTLFQSHFLLFHHLYHLQCQLWSDQQGNLEISPLNIRLSDYRAGEKHLQQHDALRDYYLDTDNLDTTTPEDIEKMLHNFWQRYLSPAKRKAALEVLGLEDPVDDQTIKQSYRKLVMQHHPDRGGETGRLQSLNEVIRILLS